MGDKAFEMGTAISAASLLIKDYRSNPGAVRADRVDAVLADLECALSSLTCRATLPRTEGNERWNKGPNLITPKVRNVMAEARERFKRHYTT